jgi:ABC-type nitrate/sulfonate/bicarbonate transport system substrate-binding protein
MDTKLTLKMDAEIIEAAKVYAKAQGRSLSSLVESYLGLVAKKKETTETDPLDVFTITPFVKSLGTKLNLPKDWDYKEEMANILLEKYSNLK